MTINVSNEAGLGMDWLIIEPYEREPWVESQRDEAEGRARNGTKRNGEKSGNILRKRRSAGLKFAVITKDEGRKRKFLRITYKG